jgi:predicted Ser/Thr protein kinase
MKKPKEMGSLEKIKEMGSIEKVKENAERLDRSGIRRKERESKDASQIKFWC